jgi:hypothetical protein
LQAENRAVVGLAPGWSLVGAATPPYRSGNKNGETAMLDKHVRREWTG